MPSRRSFLGGALAGAALMAVGGCADSEADEQHLEGIKPIRYGDTSSQIGELLVPNGLGPHPVVVIVHGGWWREGWDRRGTRDMARDLARRGYATWNLEYRLVGEEGGGWTGTFDDVAAGIDSLADEADKRELDLDRVLLLGHSAGGQLVQWAAVRDRFAAELPGAGPRVTPIGAVALAPVADLIAAAHMDLGEGAVQALLGGTPDEVPFNYLAASPTELIPYGVPQIVYHSVADEVVPIDLSRGFRDQAAAMGSPVELVEMPEGGHFDLIDTRSVAWEAVRDRIADLIAGDFGGGQAT